MEFCNFTADGGGDKQLVGLRLAAPQAKSIEWSPRALSLPVYDPELTRAVKNEKDIVYKTLGLPCPSTPALASSEQRDTNRTEPNN